MGDNSDCNSESNTRITVYWRIGDERNSIPPKQGNNWISYPYNQVESLLDKSFVDITCLPSQPHHPADASVCSTGWAKINPQEAGIPWGAKNDSKGAFNVASHICGTKLMMVARSGGVDNFYRGKTTAPFGATGFPSGSCKYEFRLTPLLTTGKSVTLILFY